jgi:hypothetical protein
LIKAATIGAALVVEALLERGDAKLELKTKVSMTIASEDLLSLRLPSILGL